MSRYWVPDHNLSREHVYYRGQQSGENAPARILWYGDGSGEACDGEHGSDDEGSREEDGREEKVAMTKVAK